MEMETSGKVNLVVIAKLYKEFTGSLANFKVEASLQRLAEAIQISRTYVRQLREYVVSRQFDTVVDEINFFKNLKSKFFSHLFYYSELYQIEINHPMDPQSQKKYYQAELEKINADFEKNKFFYSYLRSDNNYLDEVYFLRGKRKTIDPTRILEEIDPDYSTGHDFLVAAFLANEKLAVYLTKKVADATSPHAAFDSPKEIPGIIWTDSKTALIELVYAFKAKGSFNNGKATLKEITDHIQQIFGIEITNPTRDFQDILRRKTGYTNYLDSLRESYLKYIDDIETKDRR